MKNEKYKIGSERMTTEFFVPLKKVPTITHQQKQVTVVNGKPMFYEPAELKTARAKLMAYLGQHVPERRYTVAVRLVTKWCFPLSARHQDGEYKTTKPDIDNSLKLMLDCMTELGFWKDDSLVVSLIAEKFWAKISGIYIRIDEV